MLLQPQQLILVLQARYSARFREIGKLQQLEQYVAHHLQVERYASWLQSIFVPTHSGKQKGIIVDVDYSECVDQASYYQYD